MNSHFLIGDIAENMERGVKGVLLAGYSTEVLLCRMFLVNVEFF